MPATRIFRVSHYCLIALLVWTLGIMTVPVAPLLAMQAAPPNQPMPAPPPVRPPAGFSSAETEFARIFVAPDASTDAESFARSWGLLIDSAVDQLSAFLPLPSDKIDFFLYADDLAYARATAGSLWPETEAIPVQANPLSSDVALDVAAFSRLTPLEAENALRHALAHVVARQASHGEIPRGFDEGLAAYFERPAPARLARHAALVQNSRAGGDLLSWSDLNRPATPDAPPAVVVAHAYSLVAFLLDRHGPGVLGDAIVSLAEEPDWRATLRELYGRAPDELEAQWAEALPRWTAGGWRTNLLAAFDLQPARDLIELGHYATARRDLEQSLRLFTDLDDEDGIAEVNALLVQVDTGLQAELFMTQTQAALEQHDYERAQSLLQQARSQYGNLSNAQEPTEILTSYETLAQAGLQAGDNLNRARLWSARWVDYQTARAAALDAGAEYARLGDDARLTETHEVMEELDARQRRLVLLFGGLAVLSAAWLMLWLWARGDRQLNWGQ